jgi:hypothetical protein
MAFDTIMSNAQEVLNELARKEATRNVTSEQRVIRRETAAAARRGRFARLIGLLDDVDTRTFNLIAHQGG